ncbi:hypothetical protein ACMD2_08440 [Ananas comosus]|uniref:Uncharacterized protein n=1 Tax=Ananas comosus TaxID=4615 RepID=A0A199VP28_ANACO|nr:hypothetical protein ACMD2_08440 [Ananas comosus]
MTVFSWRVKGFLSSPTLSSAAVHVFTKKNPRSPAETEVPVVRLSFMTMTLNIAASTKLTTKARSPMAVPITWLTNMERGDARVM